MRTFADLRERWGRERPTYNALCRRVKCKILLAAQNRGIDCQITARTKETQSLIKKAIRKQYANPFDEVRDKAGVRIVCTYRSTLGPLEELIRELFDVSNYENKSRAAPFDRFGYSGLHFEILLPANDVQKHDGELAGLICEIQLLTRAQSLWADISHELAYKPSQEPPRDIRRLIHLQSALLEIFDNQMDEARRVIVDLPEFPERQLLDALDKHFHRLTTRGYDEELSLHILENMQRLLPAEWIERFQTELDAFVERNMNTISLVFENYAEDESVTPLLFQPESLFLFMCMEYDLFRLKDTWAQFQPLELLQDLADIWGVNIGTIE